ncbi:hypothetical protein N7486_005393 [Penicillium sp. IBT 16267x]|nr:hypothetical protein N7486_005393 [Penicillium sp. IBT 16267x]
MTARRLPHNCESEGCLAGVVRGAELAKSNAIAKSRARDVSTSKPNVLTLQARGEHPSNREKLLINGCLTDWNVLSQS